MEVLLSWSANLARSDIICAHSADPLPLWGVPRKIIPLVDSYMRRYFGWCWDRRELSSAWMKGDKYSGRFVPKEITIVDILMPVHETYTFYQDPSEAMADEYERPRWLTGCYCNFSKLNIWLLTSCLRSCSRLNIRSMPCLEMFCWLFGVKNLVTWES